MSLYLYRKEGESIVLFTGADEQIMLTVHGYKNGRYRFSITAPESVNIMREELLKSQKDVTDHITRPQSSRYQ